MLAIRLCIYLWAPKPASRLAKAGRTSLLHGVATYLLEGFWESPSEGLGAKYCCTESDMVP